jgi:hypothetical protein
MQHLYDMIGVEQPLTAVSRALKQHAGSYRAPLVGAMHVTCSDESERECVDTFQDVFVNEMLPELKFHSHSPFRSANLGGRYEWGAVRIAEQHFATKETAEAFKVLVVKINSHVCVDDSSSPTRYGHMARYGQNSVFCGALHALLSGDVQPFARQLKEAFLSEGVDRIAALREIDENVRALSAAISNARL